MATRAEIKQSLRGMLGLTSDDPLGSDDVLNPVVNQAYQQLVAEVAESCPDALAATATLTVAAQIAASPTDLYQVRAIRETDATGSILDKRTFDELTDALSAYAITGISAPFTITLSSDLTCTSIHLTYTKGAGAVDLADDAATPPLLPVQYHDVIALESLFAMEFAGEQRRPPALEARWVNRKAGMLNFLRRVAGPGAQSRTRMVVGQD